MTGVIIIAILTMGAVIAGAICWRIGTKTPPPGPTPFAPADPMTAEQIDSIEVALELKLPASFRDFLGRERDAADPDETAIMPWPEGIIDFTREYWEGFSGLKPWPRRYLAFGDQGDACAYALDCESGEVIYTDKGNLNRNPLKRFASFEEFLADYRYKLSEIA